MKWGSLRLLSQGQPRRFLRRAANENYRTVEALREGKGGEGDSEAVYLMRGSVLSLVFIEPNKPERLDEPDRPNRPAPRHAPRSGSGTFSFIWQPTQGSSYWPKHRLTAVSGGRNIKADRSDYIRAGGGSRGESSRRSAGPQSYSAPCRRGAPIVRANGTPTSRS